MILHPEAVPAQSRQDPILARDAIGQTQAVAAERYKLVHQPEHARLSGELVRHLRLPGAPPLSDDIVRGIASHDDGWAEFDSGKRKLEATPAQYSAEGVALNAEGKPLSFLDIKPGDALHAWNGSIENAEAMAPIAGLIVSGHFYRLAKLGLHVRHYSPEETGIVTRFIAREEQRQERLLKLEKRTPEEVSYWTDVLRFCDLLSLYLCCGSNATVEFPERIGPAGATIRLQFEDGAYTFSPQLMAALVEFEVRAQQFPRTNTTTLRWKLR